MRSAEGRVVRGYVPEVSVLAPGVRPAEPRAKVMRLREATPPRTQRRDREVVIHGGPMIGRSTRGEKEAREMAELRRRLEAGGYENFELILQAYKLELGYASPLARAS